MKLKPANAKSNKYIYFNEENNKEDPKFEVGDHVRISKNKNNFAKGFTSNWSEKVFGIKKIKKYCSFLLIILTVKKLFTFYKNELQKINQKEFRVEKVIKRKEDKLYVKWKVVVTFLMVGFIKRT